MMKTKIPILFVFYSAQGYNNVIHDKVAGWLKVQCRERGYAHGMLKGEETN